MDTDDSVAAWRGSIAGKAGFLNNSAPSRAGSTGSTRKSAVETAKTRKNAAKAAAPKKAAKKPAAAKPGKRPAPGDAKSALSRTSPRKRAAAELKAVAPVSSAMLELVLAKLDDMKAEQTVVIDMRGRSLFADHVVVTSGRSNRHVASIAESVARSLKEAGYKKVHVEGLTNADWVLIDTGEVTLHIFRPEVREFYNLERLWTHGPEMLATPA